MMTPVVALYKKDLKILFTNSMIYFLAGLCCVIWGTFFSFELYTFVTRSFSLSTQVKSAGLNIHQHLVADFLVIVHYVLVVVLAALSLRFFAEEKKGGTFPLLLTSPMTSWQLVMSKWFTGVTMVVFLLAVSSIFPLSLLFYTSLPFDLLLFGYLGLFLVLATYVSVGLLASAVTDSLIVCVILTLMLSVFLLVMPVGREFTDSQSLQEFFSYLSYDRHFGYFRVGIANPSSLVFLPSVSVFFLVLTERVIESHRWR